MKYCKKCHILKDETEFNKKSSTKDGLQPHCRACGCLYTRDHYKKNKDYYKAKSRNHSKKTRQIIIDAKNVPCMDCGISYPYYVMDFDHRDGNEKEFNIAEMAGAAISKLEEEIKKCDVVCANCHRERTHGNNAVVNPLASNQLKG